MATLAQKHAAERDARAMLDDHGLPQPDEVEFGFTCIRLIWREERVCLVVDIDEPPPPAPGHEDEASAEDFVPGY